MPLSPSAQAIVNARSGWARGKLLVAWRTVERLAEREAAGETVLAADRALVDAVAIATEWGIDCKEAIEAAGEMV